jgi:alcohol dehydrogenase class IV
MTPFTFNTTPSIVSGAGAAARLGEIVKGKLGQRVLVVTDAGVMKAGLVDAALESLTAAGVGWAIYSHVVADPPEQIIHDALAQAREFGAEGVIGLGGGSSLDVAKLVALIARSGETLTDIYGVGLAKGPRLPLALVPTTAGTGSEVTPISIVTTGASEKKGVVSPVVLPDIAVLDADLTLKLPPHVTAATGIDAMVHAIEAYTSASANNNPVSRTLAMEALRLLGANIRIVVTNGDNRDARGKMLLGSLMAGQAFANSPVAAVHALAYPVGGTFHVPHGLSNALVLPHVLAFNASAARAAYADLAPLVFPQLADKKINDRCDGFIIGLANLSADLGLETRLRDVKIPKDALPILAADAMKQTRLLVNNPRPLHEADARAIYEKAW